MTPKKSKKMPVKSDKQQAENYNTAKKSGQKGNSSAKSEIGTIVSIYKQDQQQEVDMTKLERKKMSKKKLILYLITVVLVMFAIASIAGFFIFNRGQGAKENSIELTISAPKEIDSGEEIELEITYLNIDNVAIKDADLTILYPEGFYFSHSEPQAQNEANTYWKLQEMPSGAGGKIKIYGQVIGDIKATKTFLVSVSYTPANFSSVFEEKESHSLEIAASIIDLSLTAPIRIVSGQETEIAIKFKNNSELPLSKIKLIATYPDGFSVKESDPQALEDGHSWLIDRLAKKEEQEIKLKGIFQGNPGDNKEISVQLGLIMENGEFRLQTTKSALVILVKPELNLQLTVNESNQEAVTDLGNALEYQVTYKNASDVELKNIVLKAQFTSEWDILDLAQVNDPQNGNIEEDGITWSAQQIPALASIIPKAEGSFSFTMPTISVFAPRRETDRNFSVDNYVKVSAAESEDTTVDFEKLSESNHVTVKVNSKVSLGAEGHYYSEEFEKLGSGPLPPEVGSTTKYRVFWTVSNLYNDIEDVEITAELPSDVYWTGHASSGTGGAVTFDSDTRKVTWKINRLSANSGQLYPVAEANFEVSITPKAKQVDKLMVLANQSVLTARDSFTNLDVSANDQLITTDLENDVAAQGRGIVVPKTTNLNLNQNSNDNQNSNTNSSSNSNLNSN